MRFAEIDLFGVYVAPMSLMMVGAWIVTITLRRVASHFGLLSEAPKVRCPLLALLGNRACRDRRLLMVLKRAREGCPSPRFRFDALILCG